MLFGHLEQRSFQSNNDQNFADALAGVIAGDPCVELFSESIEADAGEDEWIEASLSSLFAFKLVKKGKLSGLQI